jgi:(5R)-carbapenem-3-carboxylate synthase
MTSYQPLTPSGKGVKITDRKATSFSVDEIRELLARFDWIAFKGHPVSPEEAHPFLEQFGKLVQNDRRKGVVLKIDASGKDKGEVLLGDGYLPLHRDGALMGNDIAMVGILCVEYKDVVAGGRTFVSDAHGALQAAPKEILDLIRERGIEGRPVDKYYTKAADQWHWVPGFTEFEGKSYLNGGFPYPPGEQGSWRVRIKGVDEAESVQMFETLRKTVLSDQYAYYHEWAEGDLLLLDNRKVLHGRDAFRGQRALANIQVLAA